MLLVGAVDLVPAAWAKAKAGGLHDPRPARQLPDAARAGAGLLFAGVEARAELRHRNFEFWEGGSEPQQRVLVAHPSHLLALVVLQRFLVAVVAQLLLKLAGQRALRQSPAPPTLCHAQTIAQSTRMAAT